VILLGSITETLGTIIMKNRDLVFYAIPTFSLALLVLLPIALATGISFGDGFPGITLIEEWIKSGEQFVFSKN
jgi:hypothetical protein